MQNEGDFSRLVCFWTAHAWGQTWRHVALRRQVSGHTDRMRNSMLGNMESIAYSLSQNFLEYSR